MSIDLDAIRQRHLRPEQMEHRTYYAGHIVIDLSHLCDEVERLRAEVERRRDVYELMGAVEHSANTLAAHEDRGAWDERAAVVAWLFRHSYDDTAERIERGEHRREETK